MAAEYLIFNISAMMANMYSSDYTGPVEESQNFSTCTSPNAHQHLFFRIIINEVLWHCIFVLFFHPVS